MFNIIFPGESARLLSLWNGLDVAEHLPFPLMGFVERPFGLTNYLAPVLAVLAVVGIHALVSRLVRRSSTGEDTAADATLAGRIAGGAATVAFLLSSATLSAATHVEPALFGVVTTLAAMLALAGALAVSSWVSYLLVAGAGALFGFFAGECPLASVCAVLAAVAVVRTFAVRVRLARAFAALALFGLGFALGFVIYMGIFSEGLVSALITAKRGLLAQIALANGGGARAVFALLPFLVAVAVMPHAFGDLARTKRLSLAHVALLPLILFGLFTDFAAPSVASSAFVAVALGETLAYFAVTARADYRNRAAAGTRFRNVRCLSRLLALAVLLVGALLSFARALTTIDTSHSFVDRFAGRVLDGLGSRTWLVTDGRIDDHLRILAARRGQDISFVNMSRDLDPAAQKAVAAEVRRRLGDRAPALLRSLDLGLLPFLEDWIKTDPSAASSIAVMGAPDILAACGCDPVPEVTLFGTDPKASADWSVWPAFAKMLPAPEGWGSASLERERDPLVARRLDLRRHLGLVANNRGVWLQEHGDREGAFRLYMLVLDEIDPDNVSALFNALALDEEGYEPAVKLDLQFKKRMKAIIADETRRYRLWALANYYGTLRNVPALISRGYAWAGSGRPGAALAQVRRAIDLVPNDKRGNLMNMLAALLADADQRAESRRVYEQRLAEKTDDHTALVGLVRLELLAGNEAQAQAYLTRAVAAGGDDPRVQVELALLAMMKGDSAHARDILKAVTANDAGNLKAWSMLAAVTMQVSDAEKDAAKRAALDRELEEKILPAMESRARGSDDYYVHSTRAFIAIRKGEAGRKAARAALQAAVESRPDVHVTRELLLGMDIALNDPVSAESDARRTLRQDRNSPMANYVMGSLALGKNELADAEAYLRKAVAIKRPTAYALNDFAETLRLLGRPSEGEPYARRAVKDFPGFYAPWDTLANILLDRKGEKKEILSAATKAAELVTKDGRAQDAGVLVTLARAQALAGDTRMFNMTMRKIESRVGELDARQKAEYEKLRK